MSQLAELRNHEINAQGNGGNLSVDQALLQQQQGIDVWGIISRRKWLIILGMIVGLGLGYIYMLQATPMYESVAQISIENQKPPVIPLMTGMDTQLGSASEEAKHAVFIKSPTILEKAMKLGGFEKLPTFIDDDKPMLTLSESLDVELVEEGTNTLNVSFVGPNPDDSQKIVDSIITAYQQFLDDKYNTTGTSARDLFVKAKDEILTKLDTLNKDYSEFRKNTPLLYEKDEAVNIHVTRQTKFEQKRTELREQINTLTAKAKSLAESLAKPDADLKSLMLLAEQDGNRQSDQLSQQNIYQRQLYMQLVVEEESLTQRYGPDHPDVIVKRNQIKKFEDLSPGIKDGQVSIESPESMKKYLASYLQSLQQKVTEMTHESMLLDEDFDREEEASRELQKAQADDKRFRDDIDRQQQLFEVVVKSLEGMEMVSESKGYIYTKLAAPAVGEKVSPLPLIMMPISAMLGILTGFGLAYLVDIADKAFRTPDEVASTMRLPVVGHIPLIESDPSKLLPGSKVQPTIVCLHRPKSPQSESYRAVRTALYFSNREQRHQVIQVTSPMPGDGKSTLAANLAVTIAQSGKQVLIMDCDFRRPTLHKVFGIEKPDIGLASVVSGETEPADAMYSLAEAPNLKIMPCGPRPGNPSELLSSEQFEQVLDVFREQFDFVIVDTPPVLAVSDPCAVAARVDGVLLTFRIHKRARPLATRARDALVNMGAHVIGVVVNGVDQEAGGYYSQYRYGYSGYRYAYNYRYGYGQYGTESNETKAIKTYFEDDTAQQTQV